VNYCPFRNSGARSRRALRTAATGIVAALALTACASSTPVPTSASTASSSSAQSATTEVSSAAYVDVTTAHDPLARIAEETGLREVVLGFVLADDGECRPSWGGLTAVDDAVLATELTDLRATGATVTVASGGASGDYLENACGDAEALAAAYGQALDATGSERLDVDVEREVAADTVLDALALLRDERGTAITLTLPVAGAEKGLTDDAVALVAAAADRGLDVSVNAMTMNFPYSGSWAGAMMAAADRVAGQLAEVWPQLDDAAVRSRLGLTFMAGRNDTGPVTALDDATTLAQYAASGGVASLAFWSLARDNGGCPDDSIAQPTCSGIAQDDYAFARAVTAA
jgi:chitinase